MKSSTARPEAGSNRRQSTRSVRTTTHRPENYYARPWGRNSTGTMVAEQVPAETIGFFPAITHFTDSIAALPKEVVRHLTVLKETEGKAYAPDNAIKELEKAIASLPPPNCQPSNVSTQPFFGFSVINSANVSVSGSITNGSTTSLPGLTRETTNISLPTDAVDEQADLPRRHLFHKLRLALHEMTNILEEKNHYITSANDALAKQLARLDSSFPYIKEEISEEAREGSNRHWALPHMRDARRVNGMPTTERTRRDYQAANSLAAAAAAVHEGDIAATRSEARREAMLAKRSRNHHVDSDFDDRPVMKKSHKKRVQEGPERKGNVITTVNGAQPAQANKRRRIDKYGNGGVGMERSMSGAINSRTGAVSPRDASMADGARKKSRHGPAPASRKRVTAKSPSLASSPTRGTFSTTTHRRDYSPVTGNAQSSAVTQTTSYPVGREASHNGPTSATGELRKSNGAGRIPDHSDVASQPTSHPHALETGNMYGPAEEGDTIEEDDVNARPSANTPSDPSLKHEANDSQPTLLPEAPTSVAMTSTRSRGGSKASKPSTPTVSSFADRDSSAAQALNVSAAEQISRSRSTRGGVNGPTTSQPARRSHKKGGGLSAATIAAVTAPSDEDSDRDAARGASEARSAQDGDADVDAEMEIDEEDPDEPGGELYCLCDRPSFGAMIACDNEECPREWFHLDCVGLERAPPGKTKWFCPECRELGMGASGGGAGGGAVMAPGQAARGRTSVR